MVRQFIKQQQSSSVVQLVPTIESATLAVVTIAAK